MNSKQLEAIIFAMLCLFVFILVSGFAITGDVCALILAFIISYTASRLFS